MSGLKNTNLENTNENMNSGIESGFNRRSNDGQRWWNIPRRYHVAIMCYLAFGIRSWMNTNLWAMFLHIFVMEVDERNVHFPTSANWTVEDFEATNDLNYWGSAVIQFPAAIFTLYFSPAKIMLVSILLSSILHMMLPFIISKHVAAMGFFTFLQGTAAGVLSCSCMGLWKEWAPLNERTSLLVFTFSGQMLNYYVTFYLGLYLAEEVGPFSIYYITGSIGLVWCLLWNTCIYETPTSDRLISVEELCYLEEKVPVESKEKVPLKSVPVKSILTSLPVMSLVLVFFTRAFLNKVMIVAGMFLNSELLFLKYDPTISHWVQAFNIIVLLPASGFLVDLLIRKKIFTTLQMRKIFCCGGFAFHAVFLFCTFIPDILVNAVCYNFSFIFLALTLAGFIVNILELSPRYACVIMAFCSSVGHLSTVIFDFIIEAVQGEDDITHTFWKKVLIPCGILALITGTVFGIFASSDEQPWSVIALPSRCKPRDSRCYPKNNTDDDSLVSETL